MYMRRVFNARVLAVAFLAGLFVCAGSPVAFGQSCTAACLNRVETFTQQQTFGNGTFSATNSFTGGTTNAFILGLIGTTGSPNTNTGAGFIFENIQNTNSSTVNAVTGAFLQKKLGSGTSSRGTALYSEIEDDGGGSAITNVNFSEGFRSTCTGVTSTTTVSCYGAVHTAQTNSGVQHVFLIGSESGVIDDGTVAPGSTFNKNFISAAYLADCGTGTQNCDSGFITNPFNQKTFREGFLATENSVSDAAFRSRAATNYGVDLCGGIVASTCQSSQAIAAVLSPNMAAISAMNYEGTSPLREIYVNTYDQVIVGDQPGTLNINLGTTNVPVYVAQYNTSTSGALCVDPGGFLALCTSSRKYKADIAPLSSALSEVANLSPVSYTSKINGRREIGFVAEDVDQIDPRLSSYNKDGLVGVQYDHLTALLAKAIQEQQAEIEKLRAEIKVLKKHR